MSRWLLVLTLTAATFPAFAQPATPPAIRMRVATLVSVLRDAKAHETTFSPSFLSQIPGTQIEQVTRQLRETNGAVLGVASVTAESSTQTLVSIDYTNGTVTARMALEAPQPHHFIGPLITDIRRRGDSFEAIICEIKKLPGTSALLIEQLGDQKRLPSAA